MLQNNNSILYFPYASEYCKKNHKGRKMIGGNLK